LVSIWDDGYGISVANEFQMTKGHISELLKGFQRDPKQKAGYDIYEVKGWDYAALCETYISAATIVRMEHVPAIIHVTEVTQPQGHSTSGSHERYKSKERLDWEVEFDGIRKMREWMVGQGIATNEELEQFEKDDLQQVRDAQRRAWAAYRAPIDADVQTVLGFLDRLGRTELRNELARTQSPFRRDAMRALTSALIASRDNAPADILEWRRTRDAEIAKLYDDELYSENEQSALRIEDVPAQYDADAPEKN